MKEKLALIILDGWGCKVGNEHDAISAAHTPNFDEIIKKYPNCTLKTSSGAVGLPKGQMGNSEVGHMTIGSGRVIKQSLPRINDAISNIEQNTELKSFIDKLKKSNGTCHLLGLVSDGGVHSHINHMIKLTQVICQAGIKVSIHAFLDGRDVDPYSSTKYLDYLEKELQQYSCEISTISGRSYSMDRDQNWERTDLAISALIDGNKTTVHPTFTQHNIGSGFWSKYNINQTTGSTPLRDELIKPQILNSYEGINDGDGYLITNFRADRVRQTLAKLECEGKFKAKLGMTQYINAQETSVLFPPIETKNTLGEIISNNNLTQLRIAETEKFAHVTYFMNCGRSEPFSKEDRILIDSPKNSDHSDNPAMSAHQVTESLVNAIVSQKYHLIIANYANPDIVGHTGDFAATVEAINVVDQCLGKIISAAASAGMTLMITADHGNAEEMFDTQSNKPKTSHTTNDVPFILVSDNPHYKTLNNGTLANIAPTILKIMGINKPTEMTEEHL